LEKAEHGKEQQSPPAWITELPLSHFSFGKERSQKRTAERLP